MTARSNKIRQSARDEDCLVRIPGACTFDPAKTIASHYRGSAGGKGLSHKASDLAVAYCCTACDAIYDGQAQRPVGLTKDDIDLMWCQGHLRTLIKLEQKGLVSIK